MEKNISFTGINNFYLGKKVYNKMGSYISQKGNEQLPVQYTDILIKCVLTNDKTGEDLSAFNKALDKCGNCFQANNIRQTNFGNFKFIINRSDIKERNFSTVTDFIVNGCHVFPNERNILPLFTYLAALTRKLAAKADISELQKQYLSLANRSIADEAVKYIDSL